MFMPAAPAIPDPTTQPNHDPAAADEASRVGRLLALVRRLIDYGKELAASLQRHHPATDPTACLRRFGTSDIALIIARITRGLRRARALEARVLSNAVRLEAGPKPRGAPSPRSPRPARPAVQHTDVTDPDLAHLPTPEQIEAWVRRRPIGAVIADICRDLRILPSHPLWRQLSREITRHGGSLAALLSDIMNRPFLPLAQSWPAAPALSAPSSPSPLPASTGPP